MNPRATKTEFLCPDSWLDRQIDVTLVGAGGTGGEVFDGLVRLHLALIGLGHPGGLNVTVYDPDSVSHANIGRQRFAFVDCGQNKALTLVQRYNLAFGLDWSAIPARFSPRHMSRSRGDLLITCVDLATVRSRIGRHYRGYSDAPYWLDFGNGQYRGQVVLGALGEECRYRPEQPLNGCRLPHVYDLFPELDRVDDTSEPSCSLAEALTHQDLFVNRFVAQVGLNLLYQLIRTGAVDHHGAFIDVRRGAVDPIGIDLNNWAVLGYAPPATPTRAVG